ncbi:hypothetical protein OUZ56_027721 [Daphnia magna]|uniref:Uncharacterized protein n=1 Tax=Daphnia magna TaxID=35525 RepID=A0ABR0B1R1_9CRUS|nr:hypothetical protein OUZ56_027721 [Daphnia magna]
MVAIELSLPQLLTIFNPFTTTDGLRSTIADGAIVVQLRLALDFHWRLVVFRDSQILPVTTSYSPYE